MTEITVPSKDKGSFMAYIAMPKKLPAPAILVIQEIFGVNAEMRAKCDEFAAQGFIAACPDIFWRMQPGVQLTDKTEGEWAKAFDFFKRFDVDKGIDDLRATAHTLKGYSGSTGKVGCVGYCLGGKLAYLMAIRTSVDAAVGYYGVGIDRALDESENIGHPLMLHVAGEDRFVPPDAQARIVEGLAPVPGAKVHIYPGADHAFARKDGVRYLPEAAALADARTAAFLDRSLKERSAD